MADTLYTSPKRDNGGGMPGPPFAAGSADNGLSVDAVSGKIVLGNDDDGLTTGLAQLLSDRAVPLEGFTVNFTGPEYIPAAELHRVQIGDARIVITGENDDGNGELIIFADLVGGNNTTLFHDSAGFRITESAGNVSIFAGPAGVLASSAGVNMLYSTGADTSPGPLTFYEFSAETNEPAAVTKMMQLKFTDTASDPASLIFDCFSVGRGQSVFSVGKDGTVTLNEVPGNTLIINGDSNGTSYPMLIQSAGTTVNSAAGIELLNAFGDAAAMLLTNNTYTAFPAIGPDALGYFNNGVGGIAFATINPAANIRLNVNGNQIVTAATAQITLGPFGNPLITANFATANPTISIGDISHTGNSTTLIVNDAVSQVRVSGTLRLPGGASLLNTLVALTNNAGAALGTITNAPTAGDPAKWIAFNDAGTIRKIPTWL